jgi:hypothetical protein
MNIIDNLAIKGNTLSINYSTITYDYYALSNVLKGFNIYDVYAKSKGAFKTDSSLMGININSKGYVSSITLVDLTGFISPSIGNFKYITEIELNFSSGLTPNNIPKEICNLDSLIFLYLVRCNLKGSIPPEFSKMKNLGILNLGINNLSGNIPPELGNIYSLDMLDLSYNNLSGEIPDLLLNNSPSLNELDLSYNNLSGEIPSKYGKYNFINSLDLNNNNFTGAIPKEIGNITELTDLNLSNNNLSGIIPILPFHQYKTTCGIGGKGNNYTCPLPPNAKACNHGGKVQCT